MLTVTAHAKVNLALHVTGQLDNGYHLLDSLVVFTKFGDQLRLVDAQQGDDHIELKVIGPFGVGLPTDNDNLIIKAAERLSQEALQLGIKTRPVRIVLEKNLPIASGIGGGSADAAAALQGLCDFWGTGSKVDLFHIAKELGADVPMCLHSTPLRAQGIGEDVTRLKLPSPMHLVLVNPGNKVSTPTIFEKLQSKDNPAITMPKPGIFPPLRTLKSMRNDLEIPAIETEPMIANVLKALHGSGAMLTRMSGSGATCFGVFDSEDTAQLACEKIQSAQPNWWCVATTTISR